MDFIALNCNLGLALQQALNESIKSQELKNKVKRLYVDSFEIMYSKFKQELPEMLMNGKAITHKEYPAEENRQFFQAIIYEPSMMQGKDARGPARENSKIKFGKIQAMEPKNVKSYKENDRKGKRKAIKKLEDHPRKQQKKIQKV